MMQPPSHAGWMMREKRQGSVVWQETTQWHTLPTASTLARLESNGQTGLTASEAKHRLARLGPNRVTGKAGPHVVIRFLSQFHNPLLYVLLIAGAITALLPDHTVDAVVILAVVLVNAIVGFLQESRAKAAIEALSRLVRVESSIIRDGNVRRVDAEQLVPGDLVLLQSGDRVTADLRLLRLRDLRVDESMLTGESLPVAKELMELPAATSLADRKNMAYSGTLVTFGQATGVVVATGAATELGHISHLIESAKEIATPLTQRLARFSLLLTWVILALALATFGVGVLRGHPAADTFIAAVALAVAAIPEGLPAAVTIILAIGVTRMARRNAVIRKLPAVETLGSTSVICSDKTGTLTKNEMTVVTLVTADACYTVTGNGYAPQGELQQAGVRVELDPASAAYACLQAGVLCNTAQWVSHDAQWHIEGDPTEGALLVAAGKAGIDYGQLRDEIETLDTIPFESERQYMATLHHLPENGRVIYLKGAVERILPLCTTAVAADGTPRPFDPTAILQTANALADDGLRVLAFAMKPGRPAQAVLQPEDMHDGVHFLGLQGMMDPPRPEAIQAVRSCQAAGVTVKMITGDHLLTARNIARQLGIGGEDVQTLSGAALAQVTDADLPTVAAQTDVFARVAPEQKLRLVQALQARKAVVAMTGDGVNDAPALKQANIGIAMGVTGTEAAKDAADMILTDDNFASIEAAVEEGRGVFDNLRKFLTWTLPTNGGEGLLVFLAIALGIAIPILPGHLLWINLTTATVLGITLAFEPKERGLMQRPARDPDEPILSRPLLFQIAYVSALMVIGAFFLFEWELRRGLDIATARTSVVNVIVLIETAHLFNSRSLTHSVWQIGLFSNRWAVAGAVAMLLLQLSFVYTPVMQRLFQTRAVPWVSWLDALLIALAIFGIVAWEKWVRHRRALGRAGAASPP